LTAASRGNHQSIDTAALLATATELRASLADTQLPLDLGGVEDARGERDAIARQLDDYVLPRLRSIDAPALAVVGGSTGSGKSTLVNSLVDADVTRPGVLRPTTIAPVLVHHPSAERWFTDDRILPELARVTGGDAGGPTEIALIAVHDLPPGLALVDAPDIDSVVDENRALASQLLDAADLWVFVTTAVRYADAVPWAFLRRAAQRGVGVALVLNRVPPDAEAEVSDHLSGMLAAEGLGAAPVFVIDEQPLDQGRIPTVAIQPLRKWLGTLAADQAARTELIRRTLQGTVSEVANRVDGLAGAVRSQAEVLDHLRRRVDENFLAATERLSDDVRDGTVMRGEVLARWQDLVGTGDLLRQLQSSIGRLRDRLTSALTGRPTSGDRFQGAIESGVHTLVRARIAEAVERTAAEWSAHPAGSPLLRGSETDLRHPAGDLDERTARMVRDWQGALLDLLGAEGRAKRATAKALSYGVNGVALVLMVGVFAQTGGLTGAEVAVAGGSSVAGQALLEALLGDQAVRRLAAVARADLDQRTTVLVEAEADRFRAALRRVDIDPDHAARLSKLAADLRSEVAR
jgi:hypothetical protein